MVKGWWVTLLGTACGGTFAPDPSGSADAAPSIDVDAPEASSDAPVDQSLADASCPMGALLASDPATQESLLAVDAKSVYWSLGTKLASVPIASGPTTIVASTPTTDFDNVATGLGRVFWTDLYDDAVGSALPDGGDETVVATDGAGPQTLAIDSTGIYWNDPHTIYRVDADGGAPVVLASDSSTVAAIAIAIDAANVYWTTWYASGVVASVPKGGGPTAILASGEDWATRIATDGINVYWTTSGSQPGKGAIRAVSVQGGTAWTLASAQDPWAIATDGKYAYWTNNGSGGNEVRRAPVTGGAVEVLACGAPLLAGIATDDSNVYWVEIGGGVYRLPK